MNTWSGKSTDELFYLLDQISVECNIFHISMRVIDDCGGQFCKLERRYIIDYFRSVPVWVPLGYSTGKISSSEHLSLAKSTFKVRVSDSEIVQKTNQTKAAQIINMQHRGRDT